MTDFDYRLFDWLSWNSHLQPEQTTEGQTHHPPSWPEWLIDKPAHCDHVVTNLLTKSGVHSTGDCCIGTGTLSYIPFWSAVGWWSCWCRWTRSSLHLWENDKNQSIVGMRQKENCSTITSEWVSRTTEFVTASSEANPLLTKIFGGITHKWFWVGFSKNSYLILPLLH